MPTDVRSSFLEELRWRGFLEATTSDDLDAFLSDASRTIYVGFDPTADSLHIGSLIPVSVALRVREATDTGHSCSSEAERV